MFEKIAQILEFWFGPHEQGPQFNEKLWWQKDSATDEQIAAKFGALLQCADEGRLDSWIELPQSCLAYILLCDQFSRHIHRNSPKAYAWDDRALSACKRGIEHKIDRDLHPIHRQFFYMPLMHSENLKDQKHCVLVFSQLLDLAYERYPDYVQPFKSALAFAEDHMKVIERFDRFPHRNEILGRTCTDEELEFLKTHGGY